MQDRASIYESALRRRTILKMGLGVLGSSMVVPEPAQGAGPYSWPDAAAGLMTLEQAFPPPAGFERRPAPTGSFASWLRGLPMLPKDARVHLFDKREKPRQDVHAGVVAIDTGDRDLQQCADAVMRLRAEWQFASGRKDDIAFNVTDGARIPFKRWAAGERPDATGRIWKAKAARDASYASLRKYLDFIFSYAGSASLEKELVAVPGDAVEAGDVFIKGGFPGHAVLVADTIESAVTKGRRFLLVQSFMPAQEIHVLRNPINGDGSPWYAMPSRDLVTPEWTFPPLSLRRWPQA